MSTAIYLSRHSGRLNAVTVRLLGLAATALVSSFVVYSALFAAPGNPIDLLSGGRSLPPAAIAQLKHEYNLDAAYPLGYRFWLAKALRGDFGRSTVFHQDVSTLLTPRIATTVFLVVYATILTVVAGVALGLIAGTGRRLTRLLVTSVSAFALGIPGFVAAVALIAVLAVELGWFPVAGSGSGFTDRIWHLTLPAIALALAGTAYIARVSAAAIRGEASGDHVVTATARGLPRRLVVRRHILRNALIPITTVSGLTVAGLFAGTAVIEQAFQINGLGSFLISSVNSRDFAVVQAICLIIVLAFLVVNTLVDGLYRVLDPRVGQ